MNRDLSIIIPARNEEFLSQTVNSILKNKRGNTEIIVMLDGKLASPGVVKHKDVTVVYFQESIGQRAATNQGVRLSNAKYVMKCDAHCTFDEGFDVKMMKDMQPDWTMVPTMYNLHVFDWVCPWCDNRLYQGKEPKECRRCKRKMIKELIWKPRRSPETTAMRFDRNLKFRYWSGYKRKQSGDLVETMSLIGACWMLTRERYWKLNMCDEGHGSWGQQGTEVACKSWLSGGKLICTKKTWFSHMFRTQGGDFGFPYKHKDGARTHAIKYSKDLWLNNKWDKAIHDLQWMIDKFNPPDWDTVRGVVYYTDNKLNAKILESCQEQIDSVFDGELVSVSLRPIDFGKNIHLRLKRGHLTMFKQILAGLEALDTDIVFFCEHDVLYHVTHFDFIPPKKDVFYYNTNVWKLRAEDGHALRTDDCRQTSGLCAYRDLLLKHYRKRVEMVEKGGFSRKMGFEPGTHNREERVDDYKSDRWESKYPNIDIRHDKNLTSSRWKKEEYRNQKYTEGWQETNVSKIPGWKNDII